MYEEFLVGKGKGFPSLRLHFLKLLYRRGIILLEGWMPSLRYISLLAYELFPIV
jgi:hypothetical protein